MRVRVRIHPYHRPLPDRNCRICGDNRFPIARDGICVNCQPPDPSVSKHPVFQLAA